MSAYALRFVLLKICLSQGPPSWHPAPEEVKAACRQAAEYAKAHGSNISQLAIKWALQQKSIASHLIGFAKPQQASYTMILGGAFKINLQLKPKRIPSGPVRVQADFVSGRPTACKSLTLQSYLHMVVCRILNRGKCCRKALPCIYQLSWSVEDFQYHTQVYMNVETAASPLTAEEREILVEVLKILAPVHNTTWPSGRPENN